MSGGKAGILGVRVTVLRRLLWVDSLSPRERGRVRVAGRVHTAWIPSPQPSPNGRGGEKRALALRALFLGVWLGLLSHVPVAGAHESRPAYLEIKETAPGRYDVLWRTPLLAGMRLPVALKFPDDVRHVTEPTLRELPDSLVERRLIEAGGNGLAGKRIEFVGLQGTITDVLVRMQIRDGLNSTTLVRPSQPWVEIAVARGLLAVAGAYFKLGIEHILFGIDHLLFVLGLLFIVNDRWMLLKTVSSFTVAHSLTLAIATLGYARAPGRPLTAAIALSILFLGPEIVRSQRGETSLTIRHPWVVAFAFGLLHGFGFASGLTTMGLPRTEIPVALLLFNLGVEAGQILFVLVVLLFARSFRVLEVRLPRLIEALPAYAVGSLGAYWTIQRVIMMLGGAR
jgi:hydrogenase/urease accessory protein HupE